METESKGKAMAKAKGEEMKRNETRYRQVATSFILASGKVMKNCHKT